MTPEEEVRQEQKAPRKEKDRWQEELSDQYQTLTIQPDADPDSEFDVDHELNQYYPHEEVPGTKSGHVDPFTLTISHSVSDGRLSRSERIVVGRSVLRQMKSSEVLIAERPAPLRPSYYRNLVPDMNVTMCDRCFRFFMEDFESCALMEGSCPFCRKMDQTTK
jgi:hypothetical protein